MDTLQFCTTIIMFALLWYAIRKIKKNKRGKGNEYKI